MVPVEQGGKGLNSRNLKEEEKPLLEHDSMQPA